jgi:hypothetical protein
MEGGGIAPPCQANPLGAHPKKVGAFLGMVGSSLLLHSGRHDGHAAICRIPCASLLYPPKRRESGLVLMNPEVFRHPSHETVDETVHERNQHKREHGCDP